MASTFSWLDYSARERRKMLDVIDLFGEQTTRDELGLGAIRDAFADLLFPGTSTIQTRARYFLFVTWMYLSLERKGVGSAQIARRARREEEALIAGLLEGGEKGGVIGRRAGKGLKRLPSSIYWQGLGVWGIRLFPGSQDQYHRRLDRFHASPARMDRNEDGEPLDGGRDRNWHLGVPTAPEGFPGKATFDLTGEEAEYLRERVLARVPHTMLSFLLDRGDPAEASDFPWQHPQFAELPPHVREQLDHARLFSEAMHGAALLYNLMLSEERGNEDWEGGYGDALRTWAAEIEARKAALSGWDIARFWQIVAAGGGRVTPPARAFVERWISLCLSPGGAESAARAQTPRRLVRERERSLKGTLARLENRRALELWNGAAGAAALDYRWPNAHRIVTDIQAGLTRG